MEAKVRVIGKAQNRTALGIINAYLLIHPDATLADLRAAFPNSLNPDMGVKNIFVDARNLSAVETDNFEHYFNKPDELLSLVNGTKVAVCDMWTKPSFDRIVEKAKEYGIEVSSFEKADEGVGRKGGYKLEYLNGFVPVALAAPKPKPVERVAPLCEVPEEPTERRSLWWLWLLLGLVIAGLILALCLSNCHRRDTTTTEVVEEVLVTDSVAPTRPDTVYLNKVMTLEKQFNDIEFADASAVLPAAAKPILNELAAIMKAHPDINIEVIGHSSPEGNAAYNQKLSEERAQSAVAYLESQGVPAGQLSASGKGEQGPIDPNDPESNRRTEFVVK